MARSLVTEEELTGDLEALGVERGQTLVVHSSLSAIGWVLGGAPAVVRSLLGVLAGQGTLVMPAATPHCADPGSWPEPRLPEEWWPRVREHLPIFDPHTTPTAMGAVAESFRTWPGTLRSDHPLESVCARGPAAAAITAEHPLHFSEGPGSPFAKLHELDGRVLLLGVGFNRCTALHHAESLVPGRRTMTLRVPRLEGGRRTWTELENVADDNDTHFPIVGQRFLAAGEARRGAVGRAPALLFEMRRLVTFARSYFEEAL